MHYPPKSRHSSSLARQLARFRSRWLQALAFYKERTPRYGANYRRSRPQMAGSINRYNPIIPLLIQAETVMLETRLSVFG